MGIAVTVHTSPPSTDLFLSSLPSGTTRVRVWRVWNNQQQRVRGDEQAAVIGTEVTLEDYDVPVGRPVSYWAQCYAVDGSELAPLAETTPITVTMVVPVEKEGGQCAWVSDPLAPALSLLLAMTPSDRSRSYDSDTVYAQVMGYEDPIAISGIRSSASDWTFGFRAFSFEESDSINALVSPGGTILIRPDAGAIRHKTGLVYLSMPRVQELPRYDFAFHQDWADWVLSGRQVRPPSVSVVMPLREYADMEAENADYQGVIDDYTDYLALLRG